MSQARGPRRTDETEQANPDRLARIGTPQSSRTIDRVRGAPPYPVERADQGQYLSHSLQCYSQLIQLIQLVPGPALNEPVSLHLINGFKGMIHAIPIMR